MPSDNKPRFSFEITEEQRMRADRYLDTYGLRRAVFSKILDDVLDIIEEFGGPALGVLMSSDKPRDIIPSLKRADEVGRKQ